MALEEPRYLISLYLAELCTHLGFALAILQKLNTASAGVEGINKDRRRAAKQQRSQGTSVATDKCVCVA